MRPFCTYYLVFWKSKHLEVTSDSFCFLINSSWLLFFALIIILFIFTGFNIYCWTGIHFSQNYFLIFYHLLFGLIYSFHIWSRDLLREFTKKYEVLLIIFFLLFGGFKGAPHSIIIAPLQKPPRKIECFLDDLFLGSQWSIILGYRRLSVKSCTAFIHSLRLLHLLRAFIN